MQKPKWWRPYYDKQKEKMVNWLVKTLGENIPVDVFGKGTWLIPRHFIALYGIKGKDIERMAKKWGFKKIK